MDPAAAEQQTFKAWLAVACCMSAFMMEMQHLNSSFIVQMMALRHSVLLQISAADQQLMLAICCAIESGTLGFAKGSKEHCSDEESVLTDEADEACPTGLKDDTELSSDAGTSMRLGAADEESSEEVDTGCGLEGQGETAPWHEALVERPLKRRHTDLERLCQEVTSSKRRVMVEAYEQPMEQLVSIHIASMNKLTADMASMMRLIMDSTAASAAAIDAIVTIAPAAPKGFHDLLTIISRLLDTPRHATAAGEEDAALRAGT